MKKFFLYSFATVGLLGLASCAQEDVNAPANDGVNIKVRLPRDMQTRGSFGDGADAGDRAVLNNLQWSVYEVVDGVASATPVFSDLKAGAFGGSQTEETVTLPLAKGKTYQVAFYADDSTNGFVTYTDGKINVDYSKATSNTAAEDAFIGRSVQFTVDGAYSETVTLTRPFAQLNWGTDDLDAKVLGDLLKSLTASVKVSSGLYTAMDVLSGEVDAATAVSDAVEFGTVAFSALPAQTFPVEGYSLIAMDYLLTGDGTIDCELDFDNGLNPVSVNAAPVKVNYRTNIYGSLLTAPADFNIKVDNNFETPDNNIEATVVVKTPEELLDAITNAEDGDEIELAADMTMPMTGYVELSKDVTLTVPEGVTITTARQGNTANFVVNPGATVTLKGEGAYEGDNRIFDVDGTLVVDGPSFTTTTKTRGSAITVNNGGALTFKSGEITAANTALWIEGKVEIDGGVIKSNNSASDPEVGSGQWAYCVRLMTEGAEVTINGGEIIGVQGAVANKSGKLTINGGYFHTHPSFTTSDNFYALYIGDGTTGSETTVNGGEFYSQNNYAIYYNKLQAAGYPENVLHLNGGKLNNQGRQVSVANGDAPAYSGIIELSAPYIWKQITEGNFKYEVVAE